jgi:NADH-quinone oxidoreductase subunit J
VEVVVFFIATAAAIGSAVAVVAQRNPFVSALGLLGNLVSLAALMLLLEAQFVAAAQIIVYAGAIMVMFLFVIAYVGPLGEIGGAKRVPWQLALAIIAGLLIVVQVIAVVFSAGFGPAVAVDDTFGGPAAVGEALVTDYLLAFEVISVILFMAAVAGVIFATGGRPQRLSTEAVARKEAEAAEFRRREASRAAIDAARANDEENGR